MRKLTSLLFLALIAFTGAGCDSNENEATDTEKFVGLWAITGVSDATGSRLADFATGFQVITLNNTSAGAFTISIVPIQGPTQTITGTYQVNETAKSATLRASVGGQTIPLNFTYTIASSGTSIDLKSDTTTAVLLNNLFGTTLEGQVTFTVTKQS